jgi:hypothetical protein
MAMPMIRLLRSTSRRHHNPAGHHSCQPSAMSAGMPAMSGVIQAAASVFGRPASQSAARRSQTR